jgi:predicted peroxiredoxin
LADKAPTLVVISEDPRTSHRANEAMRIALGVVAGENDVDIVLTGPAVHLLDEDTDDLVDGDEVARYRGSLKKLGVPFRVDRSAVPSDPEWNAEGHVVIPIDAGDLLALVARATRFIVF